MRPERAQGLNAISRDFAPHKFKVFGRPGGNRHRLRPDGFATGKKHADGRRQKFEGKRLFKPWNQRKDELFLRPERRLNLTGRPLGPLRSFRDPLTDQLDFIDVRTWADHRHRFFVELRRFKSQDHETLVRFPRNNDRLTGFGFGKSEICGFKTDPVGQCLDIVTVRALLRENGLDRFLERDFCRLLSSSGERRDREGDEDKDADERGFHSNRYGSPVPPDRKSPELPHQLTGACPGEIHRGIAQDHTRSSR